jgi:two-component system, OmpR family, alkaline phosphatase synthesis response regulator PhoP
MPDISPAKVLIVDDERNIVDLVALYARQAGYAVLQAYDGATALELAEREQPAIVVLDLMLPQVNGWDVCKRLRQKSDVPIIMLTARSDDVDKIVGLELGADDYLTKPFNPRELMSRIKAILRRTNRDDSRTDAAVVQVGQLQIDPSKHEVTLAGTLIKLRAKEFDLLAFLAANATRVFTREKLLETVWGFDFAGETRTVDVHVAQLRKHLQGVVESGVEIETVFGVGYKLVTR